MRTVTTGLERVKLIYSVEFIVHVGRGETVGTGGGIRFPRMRKPYLISDTGIYRKFYNRHRKCCSDFKPCIIIMENRTSF
jgi:hypothetical protein